MSARLPRLCTRRDDPEHERDARPRGGAGARPGPSRRPGARVRGDDRRERRRPRRGPRLLPARSSTTSRPRPRRCTSTSTASDPARSATGSRARCSRRRPRASPSGLVVDRVGSRPRHVRPASTSGCGRRVDVRVVRATGLRAPSHCHFDHRKLFLIDGRVGWVGGAGIEDHFEDGRFHDLFLRLTGPVVSQLQLVFVATFRWLERHPRAAAQLDALFPGTRPGASPRPCCTTRPAATARSRPRSPSCSTARARRSTSSTPTSPTRR